MWTVNRPFFVLASGVITRLYGRGGRAAPGAPPPPPAPRPVESGGSPPCAAAMLAKVVRADTARKSARDCLMADRGMGREEESAKAQELVRLQTEPPARV